MTTRQGSCGSGNGGRYFVQCKPGDGPKWAALAVYDDQAESLSDGEAIGYNSEEGAKQAAVANCNRKGCHVVWSQAVSCETKLARGTWADPATGLMWMAKDNGADVNWNGANNYCANVNLGGYAGWRLPTIDELKGIYGPGEAATCTLEGRSYACHIKGEIVLTGYQWSATLQAGSGYAWIFYFDSGKPYAFPLDGHSSKRALCVRRSGE